MENKRPEYWKIIRILLTDSCNIQCRYCHNEGQENTNTRQQFIDFERLIEALSTMKDRPIQEIRLSGGEPTLHPKWVDLVEWIDQNFDVEIGMATNALSLNAEKIQRIARTNIQLNIHLPATSNRFYKSVSTVAGFSLLKQRFRLLEDHNIKFSLNFVYEVDDVIRLQQALLFCEENSYDLKILPQTEGVLVKGNPRDEIRNIIRDTLPNWKTEEFVSTPTTYTFQLRNNDEVIKIKLVEPPCFTLNHNACASYGEIRILPTLRLQSCILDSKSLKLFEVSSLKEQMDSAWSEFVRCPELPKNQILTTKAKRYKGKNG